MSAVAITSSPAAERVISSRVLGDLALAPEQLFAFPEGLHGFESQQEFALVPAARDGFWWLQSATEAGLAFLLVDPFRASAGYELDLSPGDEQFLALDDASDALVLTIVTLPAEPGGTPTTNLRGPLVFNVAQQRARQVVSRNEAYAFHAPVSLDQMAGHNVPDATGA